MMGPETFSERIRMMAKAAGSQKKLAEKLGLMECTVSHYANGDYYPNMKVLYRIKERTGLKWEVILGE